MGIRGRMDVNATRVNTSRVHRVGSRPHVQTPTGGSPPKDGLWLVAVTARIGSSEALLRGEARARWGRRAGVGCRRRRAPSLQPPRGTPVSGLAGGACGCPLATAAVRSAPRALGWPLGRGQPRRQPGQAPGAPLSSVPATALLARVNGVGRLRRVPADSVRAERCQECSTAEDHRTGQVGFW